MEPAEAVEVCACSRISAERPLDVVLGLIEVRVPIGPHEAEIITSLTRVRRIEFDRFLEKFRRLVIELGPVPQPRRIEEKRPSMTS